MTVRVANITDKPLWLALRRRLLPALSDMEHERDWLQMMEQRGQRATILCVDGQSALLGMIVVFLRPSLDGLGSGPVAYVDALHVEPGEQRDVSAKRLTDAAAKWAEARACRVLASDTSFDNQWEQKLHRDLGFEEVARKVIYRKVLTAPTSARALAGSGLPRLHSGSPTELHAGRQEARKDDDDSPRWWPGPVRAGIIVLGILSFLFTDVYSSNAFFGIVLPIVDVVFAIYLMMLFVSMKYRRRMGSIDERPIELYRASNDGD